MKKISVMTVFLLAGAAAAYAGPIGPTYPAPGGSSFSATGPDAAAGTSIRTYSGFNPAAWSELYFGFDEVDGPLVSSTSSTSTSQILGFSGYDNVNGDFVWKSATDWTFSAVVGSTLTTITTPVEFTASFWNAAGTTSINSAVVTGGSVGIPSMPIVLAMDPSTLAGWGGGYQVHASFITPSGASLDSFFASYSTPCSVSGPGCVQSGTDGEFYYTAPVPEPASLLLLGTGLLGIGRNLRRRVLSRG